jgi:hypothetical protein
MSESSFPFEAAPEPEPLLDEVEGGDSRRTLLVAGGLVGALVLGAGAFLLLSGGDDEELGSELPQAKPQAEAPAAEPQEVAVIPVASTETVGRNPFKARYIAPVGAPATGTSTDQPTSAATDVTPERQAEVVRQSAPSEARTPTSTPTSTRPSPAPAATPSTPATPATPATPGTPGSVVVVETPKIVDDGMRYPVTLQSIGAEAPGGGGPAVIWGYGEESFQVVVGKSFGRFQHLRVMQIMPDGVMLQIGDSAPFAVKVGQEIYVL